MRFPDDGSNIREGRELGSAPGVRGVSLKIFTLVCVFRAQEEVMLSKMEVASAAVNARVLENHSDFIQGMALVSELQSDLTVRIRLVCTLSKTPE